MELTLSVSDDSDHLRVQMAVNILRNHHLARIKKEDAGVVQLIYHRIVRHT